MEEKLIEIKRDYSIFNMCSLCFSTAQSGKIYNLKFGGTNNNNIRICNKCLENLNQTIKKEI